MRWLARGEIELPHHLHWLSERERAEVAVLQFAKRRSEYLTRRWTAKHAIATELAIAIDIHTDTRAGWDAMQRIEVRHHESGAPWVAVEGKPVDVDISLTDRAGWAVCLVRRDAPPGSLGIDLELVEPRSAGFVTDFFTDAERAFVATRIDDDARHLAANLLWSAKEAALKVMRVGLRADTRSVEVAVESGTRPDGWAALTVTHQDGVRFPGWWRRDGAFVLTIATTADGPPPERVDASSNLAAAEPLHSWVDQPLV
jgi:4'-phosphopantetheinyl transferase